jgi:hypothetical protein
VKYVKKKWLLLMILLTCLFCAACANPTESSFGPSFDGSDTTDSGFSSDGSSDSLPDSSIENKTHPITYKAIINGDATPKEIPSELWISGNHYPDTYVEGELFLLDDLLNEYQSKTLRLVFLGWYTDAECQNVFTGVLPEGTDAITIYAKIYRVRYTVPA